MSQQDVVDSVCELLLLQKMYHFVSQVFKKRLLATFILMIPKVKKQNRFLLKITCWLLSLLLAIVSQDLNYIKVIRKKNSCRKPTEQSWQIY